MKMASLKELVYDYKGAEELNLYAYQLDSNGYIVNGNLAHLYFYNLPDYPKAEGLYQKAISLAKGDNLYYYYLELIDLYRYGYKDIGKAKVAIDEAVVKMSDNVSMLTLAADYYRDFNEPDRARALYAQVLQLDPGNARVMQELEKLNSTN